MTHDARSAVVTVLGVDLNPQDLFDGAVTGLVYGFLAIGVILLYRASGIVNFAYGAIGSLAAVLVAKMVIDWNWPYVPALVVGVAASAAVAGAIEMTVVRRLFDSARITLFVATIGVAQLVTVLVDQRAPRRGRRRRVPDAVQRHLAARRRHHGARAAGRGARRRSRWWRSALGWFLNRTIWGIAITATAANPDASRLAGLSTRQVSTLVWVLAGALAGVTTVLAAPLRSTPVTNLAAGQRHPAPRHRPGRRPPRPHAVDAGRGRRPAWSSACVERVVFYNWANQSGLIEFVLFGIVLGGVLFAHRGASGGDGGAWALSSRVAPLPDRLRSHLLVRRLPVGAGRARPRRGRRRPADDRHQRPVLPLLAHGADRDRRRVGDHPDRVGRAALARPVRAGRPGRHDHGGRRPPPEPAVPAGGAPRGRGVRRRPP